MARELAHLLLQVLRDASEGRSGTPVDLIAVVKKRRELKIDADEAFETIPRLAARGWVHVRPGGVALTAEGLERANEAPVKVEGMRTQDLPSAPKPESDELGLNQIMALMASPETPAPTVPAPVPGPSTFDEAPPLEVPDDEDEDDSLLAAWRNSARPDGSASVAPSATTSSMEPPVYRGTPLPMQVDAQPHAEAALDAALWTAVAQPYPLHPEQASFAARVVRLKAELDALTRDLATSGNLPVEVFAEALHLTAQIEGALGALHHLLTLPRTP